MADVELLVHQRLAEAAATAAMLSEPSLVASITAAGEALVSCYRSGGKAVFCGNGGSAAESTHLAAEFVGRYLRNRPPLPALALADNQSSVTSIGNDYTYDESFSRQVEAFVTPQDIVVGMSTSGKSRNVIAALRLAREIGATTIGMAGAQGGGMPDVSSHCLLIPSTETPRIQEGHLIIGHTLCEIVELALFPPAN